MKLVTLLRKDVERSDLKMPGYERSVLDAASFFDDRHILIEENKYLKISAHRATRSHLIPLGDVLETTLSVFGITKERVQRWTRTHDCGCQKRQRWLNQWGYRQQEKIERLLNRVAQFYLGK